MKYSELTIRGSKGKTRNGNDILEYNKRSNLRCGMGVSSIHD